jgi:hypothetical protein
MAALWGGWGWPGSLGDGALVDALRSNEVRREADGVDCGSRFREEEVSLDAVVKGLRTLWLYPDTALAEYEITEVRHSITVFGSGLLRTLQPHSWTSARTGTARIIRPELIYEPDLCDYLTVWKLPKGVHPSKSRRDDGGDNRCDFDNDPEDKAQPSGRLSDEEWAETHKEMDAWIAANGIPKPNDGKQAKLIQHIADLLVDRGSKSTIRRHAISRISLARARKRAVGSSGS